MADFPKYLSTIRAPGAPKHAMASTLLGRKTSNLGNMIRKKDSESQAKAAVAIAKQAARAALNASIRANSSSSIRNYTNDQRNSSQSRVLSREAEEVFPYMEDELIASTAQQHVTKPKPTFKKIAHKIRLFSMLWGSKSKVGAVGPLPSMGNRLMVCKDVSQEVIQKTSSAYYQRRKITKAASERAVKVMRSPPRTPMNIDEKFIRQIIKSEFAELQKETMAKLSKMEKLLSQIAGAETSKE